MLLGEAAGQGVSALEACPACFACLLKPIKANEISRANMLEVRHACVFRVQGHVLGLEFRVVCSVLGQVTLPASLSPSRPARSTRANFKAGHMCHVW